MVGRKRESLPTPSNISPKTLQNVTVRGRNYEVPIILNYWTQIKTTPKKIIFLVKSFVELKLNVNVYPLNILFGINGLNHTLIGCAITIRKKISGMNGSLWVIWVIWTQMDFGSLCLCPLWWSGHKMKSILSTRIFGVF